MADVPERGVAELLLKIFDADARIQRLEAETFHDDISGPGEFGVYQLD